MAWNAGTVIGQSPNAGTEVPVGSTVTVDICAGQVQFP
ncbi:MAG: PASTA domain-containing protein [Acidimicrobiales bacterium]